jgi:hypothetical protein
MSALLLVASLVNIALTIWAVRRTLKSQHSLDAFTSKLRWALVFVGIAEFFLAFRFLGTGLLGMYIAFLGALIAGIFLFFPDASYYFGKWILGLTKRAGK